MNPFRFSKLLFIVLVFAFAAFQVQAIEPTATAVPPAEATPEATAVIVDSIPSGSPLTLLWQTGGSPDEILHSPDPGHLAVDAQGNVFVAEALAIREFDADGKFVMVWGKAGFSEGEFQNTQGIGLDAQGNVYVADFGNVVVEKFDRAGNYLTEWATESPAGPSGLAVDAQGNVYVANHRTHDHYIQKFDGNGQLLAEWGSTGSGDGQIMAGPRSGPGNIAVDQEGNLYVVDAGNNRIEKFDSDGNFLAQFGTFGPQGNGQFHVPDAMTVDRQGNIYVVDSNFIQKFDSHGNILAEWSKAGELKNTRQILVDDQDNLYVLADGAVHSIVINNMVIKKFRQS